MYDAENTNEDLLAKVRESMELAGTVEATGRIRGQWHEVLETVTGEDDVYAYWVADDDVNATGYKLVSVLDTDPDALDLDHAHLTQTDGEG